MNSPMLGTVEMILPHRRNILRALILAVISLYVAWTGLQTIGFLSLNDFNPLQRAIEVISLTAVFGAASSRHQIISSHIVSGFSLLGILKIAIWDQEALGLVYSAVILNGAILFSTSHLLSLWSIAIWEILSIVGAFVAIVFSPYIISSDAILLTFTRLFLATVNISAMHSRQRDEVIGQQTVSKIGAVMDETRAKSESFASTSHEIRSPLTGIIGMSTVLLNETEISDEQRDGLETIRNSSTTIMAILNDVLDYSRAEANKIELEAIPFDVRDVVENVLDVCEVSVQEKKIEVLVIVSRDVPRAVVGDPTRLRQVITNFVSNAVKFTANGEITIRVFVHDAEANMLKFTVSDTGIGMTPEDLARIFQPYGQATGSTTRKYGGSGLGLHISKMLVTLMHGEVGVESAPGKGSTFWATLVLPPPSAVPQLLLRVPSMMASKSNDTLTLSERCAYVVSQHATGTEALLNYLRDWFMNPVRIFPTASLAVDAVKTEPEASHPVAILLDVSYDVDARILISDAISLLSALPTSTQQPSLFALAARRQASDLKMFGADVHTVVKPLRSSRLRRELDKAVNRANGLVSPRGAEGATGSQTMPGSPQRDGSALDLTYHFRPLEHSPSENSVRNISNSFEGKTLARRQPQVPPLLSLATPLSTTPDTPIQSPSAAMKQPQRILIAEDNGINQKVATRMLSKLGYWCDVAENGQVALDLLERNGTDYYALILMDCQMPVMDGFTTTRKIREQSALQNIPIVALTANALQEDKERCLLSGMNDHLAKPLQVDTLRTTLEFWIAKSRSSGL
eukprot:TRINITY_DN2776_c0_g1_i5.p1 TRINITY_DN2776_c0_g1~~TRINITY_DN2776_c0_g1_i5.p1  ORF type:complete len:800 (-),score=91.30 TRINITY_DN2776_c0_g1_i5:313-2712(-)